MGKRENKVETYLDERVKDLGGDTRKWVSPGRSGVPDRIIMVKGYVCFVEVKTTDGKTSVAQDREIERLIKLGVDVYIVYGEHGVNKFIDHLKGVVHERSNNLENRARMVFKA